MAAQAEAETTGSTTEQKFQFYDNPLCCLVIGMAGSGKTSLMQQIATHCHAVQTPAYMINLDPGVKDVTFGANIDIRDTVDYKQVMQQYQLGPNGGIMTSLNLFATRFEQVVNLIAKRSDVLEHVFLDTPGQIEAFTWSSSGAVITESLGTMFPTVIVYVVDTPRSSSPTTFMSNMLYACSILYKTKLPFIIVFNKIDVVSHESLKEWMNDYEAFQDALDRDQDQSYMQSLTRSLSLVLDEFYCNLRSVGVSAATGEGLEDLFKALQEAKKEFMEENKPELQRRIAAMSSRMQAETDDQIERLRHDLSEDSRLRPRAGSDYNSGEEEVYYKDEIDAYEEKQKSTTLFSTRTEL